MHVGGAHPHHVFDFLAILVGTQLFWWSVRRDPSVLAGEAKWAVALGAFIGGGVGAKLIVLLEDPAFTIAHADEWAFWLSGKSIVGGILGGTIGVEIAKAQAGVTSSTGDHFAIPLAAGLAVGRVGCFLSGLEDDAYGVATGLAWGVDFGDGVPRHPTQLYEIAFALAMIGVLLVARGRPRERGDTFRFFCVGYFAFRFVEEFIRVSPRPWLGLTIYQVACLAGLAYHLRDRAVRARLLRFPARRAPT